MVLSTFPHLLTGLIKEQIFGLQLSFLCFYAVFHVYKSRIQKKDDTSDL